MQKNKKVELKKIKDKVEKKACLFSLKIEFLKNLGAKKEDFEKIIDENFIAKEDELNEKLENEENLAIDEEIALFQEYLDALEKVEKQVDELLKKLKK